MTTSYDSPLSPVTVVIATLGGDSLKDTIDALNRGSAVPAEILICIPADVASRARHLASGNVRIMATECRGQVAQRALGFQHASQDFVMQLDDDMLVEEHCIAYLLETLKAHGPKAAVAPSLMRLSTGESTYQKPRRNKMLAKIYYWLMNGQDGYQPGKIDRSGSAIGIDPQHRKEVFDTEWLAGGCVMHYKGNLVLGNFFPFKGKAYFEDVIHSYHLKAAGISLKVDSRARCWLEYIPVSTLGHQEFLRHLLADYRARKYAMHLHSKSSLRIYFFYLTSYLGYLYKRANQLMRPPPASAENCGSID